MHDSISRGAYARKQIFCPSRLVRWSHRSRFDHARALVGRLAGRRLLDYGCGDGTFLALVHDLFPGAVGADVGAAQIADCAARFRALPLTFVPTSSLGDRHTGAYDVVTCMEVLEHCLEAERVRVVRDLRRLVRPGGRVVISVPIETGPSLIGKQIGRALAAWRDLGDYRRRETYTPTELLRMTFARSTTSIRRPSYTDRAPNGSTYSYYGHKGFNWRALAAELEPDFQIEDVSFTPMPWLQSFLNSQVWFVLRPRGAEQQRPRDKRPGTLATVPAAAARRAGSTGAALPRASPPGTNRSAAAAVPSAAASPAAGPPGRSTPPRRSRPRRSRG
jgi:2-polyprenyl-3-methyl-5-hydroxy-6-metoxy-1,4-benzoquinol methylase